MTIDSNGDFLVTLKANVLNDKVELCIDPKAYEDRDFVEALIKIATTFKKNMESKL